MLLACENINVSEERKKMFLYFVDLERQGLLPTYPSGIQIT